MPAWSPKPGQGGVQPVDAIQVGGVNGTPIWRISTGTVAIDPASINTLTKAGTTFTLTGAKAGDIVIMTPPATLEDDLIPAGAVVTSNNTVTVYLYNAAGTSTDGASLTWTYTWLKVNE